MALAAVVMASVIANGSPTAVASLPRLERLDGTTVAPSRSATILLFWRSDCAPCLLELSDLQALRAAAGRARLVPVGLQPAAALRPALSRLGLRDDDTLRATEDPARLLVELGGAPPRLPLAVAFRNDGKLCARHTGLLGRDRVRAWAQTCGDVDAGR